MMRGVIRLIKTSWCGRSSAIILRGSIVRSCSRCARRVQLRAGGVARSRSRAGRHSGLLPHRPQHVPLQPVPAAHRPHPVCGDQGGSSASFQPRSARGRAAPRGRARRSAGGRYRCHRSTSWRLPPSAPHARRRSRVAATNCPRSWARRAAGESAGGEFFDGNTEVATFPGDLPLDPETLFNGTDAFRGLSTQAAGTSDFRFLRFRPPKLERDGTRGRRRLPHIRLDRALAVPDRRQARMNDRSEPRRPATFRLDDPGVVVTEADNQEGSAAPPSRSPRSTIRRRCRCRSKPCSRRGAAFPGARCSGRASPA